MTLIEDRILENHRMDKKPVEQRTYWKIYDDGNGMKMELTRVPNACSTPIQLLSRLAREKRSSELEKTVAELTPLACDLLGISFVDFAFLPERVQKEAMLSACYNAGNTSDDGLGKMSNLLGVDNWDAPCRSLDSLKRTKKKFVDYALNNSFNWFVTQTIAPSDGVDRLSLPDVTRAFALAVQHFNRKYNCKLIYIFIPEQHKSGAWHLHGLVGCLPDDALTAFKRSRHNPPYIRSKLAKGEAVFKLRFFEDKLGFNTFEPIESKEAVVRYCTKYITKELLDAKVSKNTRLLIASQGLEKPARGTCSRRVEAVLSLWYSFAVPSFTARRNWKQLQNASDYDENTGQKEKELLLADTSSVSYFKYSLSGAELDAFFSFCASHGITLTDFLQTPDSQDP